ncbi:Lcl C-terminal domain-containing protein [Salinibius halmophilus]|uniref:Lcl C-terminal domain-containing protein n=1 Tax=Salinibius halmophilus TaxID=1853216 RepID=UPI001313E5C0|nr:DUF1566 domain-containing protein [Salinibius halmophilus]
MKKIVIAMSVLIGATVSAEQKCFFDSITATTPTAEFVDNLDGTVTDSTTGLMWQACSEGQSFADGSCSGQAQAHTWKSALEVAQSSAFAGFSDWRLPNIKELESIVEQACVNPAVNSQVIRSAEARDYWSSTPDVLNADQVLALEYYFGELRSVKKQPGDTEIFVRLVRDAN